MKKIIEKLTAPLKPDEIELRIGSVHYPKGFTVLAYKDSRVDVNRLNEVFGLNWRNRFEYDNKNNLKCIIEVYNEDLKQWIPREDIGTESTSEKEKGSYSDAFKRACFRLGIGIELYRFPFIWINWNEWEKKGTKYYPKGANLRSWKVYYKDGQNYTSGISIIDENKNVPVWTNEKTPRTTKKPTKKENPEERTAKNTELMNRIDKLTISKTEKNALINQIVNAKSIGELDTIEKIIADREQTQKEDFMNIRHSILKAYDVIGYTPDEIKELENEELGGELSDCKDMKKLQKYLAFLRLNYKKLKEQRKLL